MQARDWDEPDRAKVLRPQNAVIETITPMRAAEYLQRNTCNRPLSPKRVLFYANEMRAGKWMLNGETMQFDIEGNLLNGQHRLSACIKAGVPFECYVVRGLPRAVMPTLDTGKSRSGSDNIGMVGGKNCKVVSAAIILILRAETNDLLSGNTSPPHADLVEFYLKNEDALQRSVKYSQAARVILPSSIACAFHYLFAKLDEEMADRFMEDVSVGANLARNDAVFLLREAMIQNKASKAKLPPVEIAARVVRAWGYRRQGQPAKYLRGTYGTGSERIFPDII